jgi:uncharacterized protein (TIGR03083 family)
MTMTTIDARAIPRIDHDEAMRITTVEFDRMLAALRELDDEDWAEQTDNSEWDVRAMVLHVLGAAEANGSLTENFSQMRRGKKLFKQIGGHHWVDGVNEIQIRDRADLTVDQITERFEAAAPKAVRMRRRLPRPLRIIPVADLGEPVGRINLGYLMDMVYTRDMWVHRADLARATGKPMSLTAEHDGRIVADLVAEWAAAYDHAFVLELEGPAGGRFTAGTGGEQLRIDAVDFVRILSGRGSGDGLLTYAFPL